MELGIIGLGRMGANMTERLVLGGHRMISFDRNPEAIPRVVDKVALGARSLADFVRQLSLPRAIWLMVPSGDPVDQTIEQLLPNLSQGDILIDGGENAVVEHLEPIFKTLAPPDGYLHVGPVGAGHFVKMIHNGIEYGMLQAYGEGFELLKASQFKLDLGKISHLWNQGSVVRSWLLELAENAFKQDPELASIRGYVEDSDEGRWTVEEAIERSVPAPVLMLSLFARFASRQEDSFSAKVIAALRNEFGGHALKKG